MYKIFSGGGGSKEDSILLDKLFIETINKEKEMIYLPIAMDNESYDDCYQWILSVFEPFHYKKITMWRSLEGKNYDDIKESSSIYIGGGNTYKLLHEIRRTHFDDALLQYINAGGVIYGGSAGAIIMGSDIDTCKDNDSNDYNIIDTSGLNLFAGNSLWCHYEDKHDVSITRFVQTTELSVIAIPEKSGIYYEGTLIKSIGETCYRFDEQGRKYPIS